MNQNLLQTKNLPYFLENILKVAFIVLAIIRHEYTLMVGDSINFRVSENAEDATTKQVILAASSN